MSTPTRAVLVGLPNTGKTTLFNQLTGAYFKVGNWSGVTVAAHKVNRQYQGKGYEILDLPGILSTYDNSEQVDYQLCRSQIQEADVIINVIDGRFLQRDLVLTLQLLCYQKPIISVITHMEEVTIDEQSVLAAVPCQAVVSNGIRFTDLLDLVNTSQPVDFDHIIEWPIGFCKIWQSIDSPPSEKLAYLVSDRCRQQHSSGDHEEPIDVLIAEGFYQTAAMLVDRSGCRQNETRGHDWLDRYLLHPYLGVPVFILVMYWVFVLTIGAGGALGDLISGHLLLLVNVLPRDHLIWIIFHSIGAGLATGVGFIPILGVMYALLAILEQSGYLSRVVLLTDGLMKPVGLSGHGFIPMILGFGCNVPAVLATRTISGDQQRILTAMMLPFMSCSARLSIFAVFAVSFFPKYGPLVILGLYCLGIMIAIVSVALVRYVLGWDKQTALSIHLSQYQCPDWILVRRSVFVKLRSFCRRTMGYIIIFAAVFSVLSHVDYHLSPVSSDLSLIVDFGKHVSGMFGFMGLGPDNWQAVVALLSGVVAKEIVLTTLNSLYQASVVLDSVTLADSAQLFWAFGERLCQMLLQLVAMDWSVPLESPVYQQYFSIRSALAYMVFILLYFPCISTLMVLRQECGTRWAMVSFVWTMVIAVWITKMVYCGISMVDLLGVVIVLVMARYFRQARLPNKRGMSSDAVEA